MLQLAYSEFDCVFVNDSLILYVSVAEDIFANVDYDVV